MAPIIKTFLKTIKIALIMFGTLFLLSGIILFSKDKIGSGVLISSRKILDHRGVCVRLWVSLGVSFQETEDGSENLWCSL